MNKLFCYNRWLFEEVCIGNGWDEKHIPENVAFISICGTPDCQEFVLQEREFHYFDIEHPQVLNLDFDDITDGTVEIPDHPGKYCSGIELGDAITSVEFIKNNLGKDFYIHCRAGHSRSQAFVRYILDMYDGIYDFIIRPENPPINYNQFVLSELKMASKMTTEYWRCSFIHNGYTIQKIARTDLSLFNIMIRVKELPEISIMINDSGCIIADSSLGGTIIYTDEWELFKELEKLKS